MRSARRVTDDRPAGRTDAISDHRNNPGATPERDIGNASHSRVLECAFGSLRVTPQWRGSLADLGDGVAGWVVPLAGMRSDR